MGLLSTAPEGADVDNTGLEEADESEAQAQPEAAPETAKPVPLPAAPRNSRRGRSESQVAELTTKIAGFEETLSKRDEDYRRQLADRDQQISRLMGNLEAMQKTAAQAPKQPGPDLFAEATALLEKGDFNGYQRKYAEAVRAEWKAEQQALQASQPQAPAGMPPNLQIEVMSNLGRFPKLAGNPEKSLALVVNKINELVIKGYQNTPETRGLAWEMVNQSESGGQAQSPQYSAGGREVLAGIPTGRSNGNSSRSAPNVRPPAGWEKWQAMSGMSREEYLLDWAQHHPEDVID